LTLNHWTPPRLVHGQAGTPAALPSWLTWRRSLGFIEERHGMDHGGLNLAHDVGQWLGEIDPRLALHFVLQVGGAATSSTWIGLSALHTGDATRELLSEAAADLGEVLDMSSLFTDRAIPGPRLEGAPLYLHGEPNTWMPMDRDAHTGLASLARIGDLGRRSEPLSFLFTLRTVAASAELRAGIDATQRRASSIRLDPMSYFLDPSAREVVHLRRRLRALSGQAMACETQVQIFGTPPRAILLRALEHALRADLGCEVHFQRTPAAPLDAPPEAMGALLTLLGTGGHPSAPTPSVAATPSDEDMIPF
jgi:hypothetical protein